MTRRIGWRSGMRRTVILTIATLTGLLLVWLLVVRVPPPQPPAASPSTPAVLAPPAPADPPPGEPVPARPPETPVADTATEPPAPPGTVAPASPPPGSAAPTDDADASADETADQPADEPGTDSGGDDGGPPEIDADHATDLLADMIARAESASENVSTPNSVVATLKQFDQESVDADWSENAAQHIEASLGEWIAALPADAQAHLALIHVECRETLCQVLAADNDPGTADERSRAGHEWQQAIGTLPQQPWWHELAFVAFDTQVSNADDHTLYMSYLLREAKAPPAPDAPAGTGDTGSSDGA